MEQLKVWALTHYRSPGPKGDVKNQGYTVKSEFFVQSL